MRDLITMSEIHNCFCEIVALQDSRLNMEMPRKFQVLFDSVLILLGMRPWSRNGITETAKQSAPR